MTEKKTWRPSLAFRIYTFLAVFSILGTFLTRDQPSAREMVAPWAGAITLLAGVWAMVELLPRRGWIVAVLATGAAMELTGLYTGWPFGVYVYTTEWKPVLTLSATKFFPVLLPFAWVMMVVAAWHATDGLRSVATRVALTAGIASLADLLMEPALAGPLDYWRWVPAGMSPADTLAAALPLPPAGPLPGGVPVSNALGWLLTSALGAVWLAYASRGEVRVDGWEARRYGWGLLGLHVTMVTLISLILGASAA